MMADFFFQVFPGLLFRILFRGVLGKVHDLDARMLREPIFDFFARMMRGLILPNYQLAARMGLQHLLVPANRRVAVLPINRERRDFGTRAQMHRAV